MNILLELFTTFAYLALISVGGASTVFPEMERQVVVNHHWLSHQDFIDIFALSHLAPGPNVLLVFLIGFRVALLPGAIAAGMGMFIPTSCILAGLAHLTKSANPPQWVDRFHRALVPITIGLLIAAAWIIGEGTIDHWDQIVVCGAAAVALARTNTSPAVVIFGAVALGAGKALLLEQGTHATLIFALLFGIILAVAVLSRWAFKHPVIRAWFNLPSKKSMGLKRSFPHTKRDRPLAELLAMPLIVFLIVGQGIALLWTYRNAISKTFIDTQTFVTQSFTQTKGSDCVAPASKNGTTYLQVCNAMQDVLDVPNGQFFYGGTMGAAALRSKNFLQEIQVAHPNFRLRYLDPLSVPPDSTSGIKMLLNGELSFAESQRPLRELEYQQAKDRGFTLKQIPIAMTGAAFYTYPGLQIPGLSLDQIQSIYLGKITNWKEVGGPDLPITPVSQDIDATGSTLSLLLRDLPGDRQTLSPSIHHVRDTTNALRKVAATPGAIGFGTQAIVANQHSVRLLGLAKGNSQTYIQPISASGEINKTALQDGTYPLIQRIFVIIRQDGTLDEMAGMAYANLLLSEKGQALINQAGYLPLRFQLTESPASQ